MPLFPTAALDAKQTPGSVLQIPLIAPLAAIAKQTDTAGKGII